MKGHLLNKIKLNSYLYFLVKFFILLFIVFIFDFFIGSALRYLYFKQQNGYQFRTTYSLEKTNADILIFGSSRANHHYNSEIFENRLKMSCYNVGRDGSSIFYHSAILKGILKRYTPKIIILDIRRWEFVKQDINYERIASLLPYYKSHPEIRPIVELKSKYEKYKLLSNIYPYNSSIFNILIGNLKKDGTTEIKGYLPITETITVDPVALKKGIGISDGTIDMTEVAIYETFIKDCIKAGVELHIFCSPYFSENKKQDQSIELEKTIAEKFNIPYHDYSNEPAFLNKLPLFADYSHLNKEGAQIFTNIIIDSVEKYRGKK